MKRFVRADIISATLFAAAAVSLASCTWTEDPFKSKEKQGTEKEIAIPMEQVISVAELATGRYAGDTVWVQGYIVGGLTKSGAFDFDCDTAVTSTALIIADSVACRTPALCAALNLTKAAHKEVLGLDKQVNKATVYHRKIFVQGKAATYKKIPAITNLCQYKLE